MYGRNEVEILHHHGFDVNLQNEWAHRCQGLCEMKYETQLIELEMEMERGSFTSSEHHSDAARSGGEKVSSRLLLIVAASKERQQHDRITYSTMFIQILGWFYVHSK